jgi:hypothetical protein
MSNRPTKLWEVGWVAHWESHPDHLWIIAQSAEVAARKAKVYLRRKGNTLVQIKTVIQHGTIDVF